MRSANSKVFINWIDRHAPGGLSRLSKACCVSMTTIHYCRQGIAPGEKSRKKIRKFFNMPESKLFPKVEE